MTQEVIKTHKNNEDLFIFFFSISLCIHVLSKFKSLEEEVDTRMWGHVAAEFRCHLGAISVSKEHSTSHYTGSLISPGAGYLLWMCEYHSLDCDGCSQLWSVNKC